MYLYNTIKINTGKKEKPNHVSVWNKECFIIFEEWHFFWTPTNIVKIRYERKWQKKFNLKNMFVVQKSY